MRTIMKYAAALTLTGALAVAAATPSQARHWHNGAAVGAGFVAGAVIGAAAANANNGYYNNGYYYDGYAPGYAYAPGYYAPDDYAYQPAPGYYGPTYRYYRSGNNSNETSCTLSPASSAFTPCNNQ